MRYLKTAIWVTIVAMVVGLPMDYVFVRFKDKRVAKAVSECGGRMRSIPIWPIGTEYRITFRSPLTPQQLDRLTELNSLCGTVAIAFVDCELSDAEASEAIDKLPKCLLIKVSGNKSSRLKVGP